jgi:hypothetical protein
MEETDVAKKDRFPETRPGTVGGRLKELSEQDGVDLLGLLQKSASGDRAAAEKAVAYLRRRPEAADLVLSHSTTLQAEWINYATRDPLTRFAFEERTKKLRRELCGESPTMLERLLADRIVVCALQVEIAERQYMREMEAGSTLTKAKFYEDLLDRAQRRYLAAIKGLAQIRRLQLPAVAQLNVATNQVNVAQPAGGSSTGAPVDPVPAALPDHGVVTVADVLAGRDVEHSAHERTGATRKRSKGSWH